jgi:hypothetical protein
LGIRSILLNLNERKKRNLGFYIHKEFLFPVPACVEDFFSFVGEHPFVYGTKYEHFEPNISKYIQIYPNISKYNKI